MPAYTINAGELRHRVVIEEREKTGETDRGRPTYRWKSLGRFWAKVEPLTGREAEMTRQMVATATHKVTLRYRALSAETNRIVFNDRVFNIGFVANVEERNVKLEVTCTEERR
jgi:SPP1 family predicted phage head-tail adaptor